MQIKTSTALAIFAIVMAIALVTAGSLTTSAFGANKTKKHTRHGGTGSTSTLGTTTGTSKSEHLNSRHNHGHK